MANNSLQAQRGNNKPIPSDREASFTANGMQVKLTPDLVKKYLGSVVPVSDNYYAALNAAVFTDGSFVYIPKGVRCPIDLSTYFRINAQDTGQFERTLIIADEGSFVNYLEGCTAPQRDENQLHAAVVELICLESAEIKYSTVQNWYTGDKNGKGGIYNFVTKRGICAGQNSKISWTQVESGSAITWKYPSVILKGDSSEGAFYSVALTHDCHQTFCKKIFQKFINRFFFSIKRCKGQHQAHSTCIVDFSFTSCLTQLVEHRYKFAVNIKDSSLWTKVSIFAEHIQNFDTC